MTQKKLTHFYRVNKNLINWLIFWVLSFTWGSSFILMKFGLLGLTAYQVAAIRIVSAGLVLLPTAIKYIRQVPVEKLKVIFLAGALGNLIPAFLFCLAEQGIDSALAGMLNSLTPIFVIITAALFFNVATSANKIIGIIIAFIGSGLLLLSKGHLHETQHLIYIGLVVIATLMYGYNVNLVAQHLKDLGSLPIASIGLAFNAIPALLVLIFTGFFKLPFTDHNILISTGASALLGIAGTAFATIIFYMLVKRAGRIFASMVTYGIPFFAIGWGIVYKETFGWKQVGCLVIILIGVYWTNRKPAVSMNSATT